MAKLFPELVFIRGPQKGQRAPLSKTMNIVGRDKTCDIDLQDEYASRQHARLIVEGARVRLVNTSPNGTRLNGKPTEQAVLNDGDVLGFGLECEIQFEAAESIAPARPGAAIPPPLPGGKSGWLAGPAEQAAAAVAAEAVAAGGEQPVGKRRLKKPPAIVWVGMYMLLIAALFVLLPKILGTADIHRAGNAEYLTRDRIEQLVREPLKEDRNERLAGDNLDKAVKGVEAWENGTSTREDHLFRTYQFFKEALAFAGPDIRDFGTRTWRGSNPKDKPRLYQEMMDKVEKELVSRITTDYDNAYVEQRQSHWARAQELYKSVLRTIGDDSQQDPIYKNVLMQLNVVNSEREKAKDRVSPKAF